MSSKIIRRKKHQVAKNQNDEHIKSYQKVDGFTRCPVAPDGNCFYTATGFFCGLNAAEMRELLMKYFVFKKAEYSIFFESQTDFMKAVKLNKNPRVWNSELCDIAPHAAAQILKRDIVIHNYNGSSITQIHTPFEGGISAHPPIHLFRSNDHYEILLDNSMKPNKNICALPDVSAFYGVVDLTFSDSEEEDEPEVVDNSEEEQDSDECMIRF
jgi:hypothetical protein